MQDLLSFPNISASDTAGQISQIKSYLLQMKEQLEFILQNIGSDNLSAELRNQLVNLGAKVETANKTASDGQQKVESAVSKQVLTISDVINSAMFSAAMDGAKEEIYNSVAVSIDNGFKLCDGTMVCYGKYDGDVSFPVSYTDTPVIITTPYAEITAMKNGFTSSETGFAWVSLGRYK